MKAAQAPLLIVEDISPTERLLETLPADQKPGFVARRKQSVLDRENIRAELDHVRESLRKFDSAA